MMAGATGLAAGATTQSIVSGAFAGIGTVSSRSIINPDHPHAKHIPNEPRGLASAITRWVIKLVAMAFAIEGLLILTAVLCAVAGLPAIVTAFAVALVGFIANVWLTVRTLGPICARMLRGRH